MYLYLFTQSATKLIFVSIFCAIFITEFVLIKRKQNDADNKDAGSF